MPPRILIVDDEPNILTSFSSLVSDEGYHSVTATSAEEAIKQMDSSDFDLLLLDLQLPGQSGLDLLRQLREESHPPKVLVISGQADIPAALEAVRLGAVDFLEKPVQPEKLISSVRAAIALAQAEQQRERLVDDLEDRCRIVGESKAITKLLKLIRQIAPSNSTVLITGENGTGKELIATGLYLQSSRREAPFIKVNCPGIPETLFESELFGHVKGSFTGAVRDQAGKFVTADGGTLFLDEIGDLPLSCQAKLLRVLETGEVETLGSQQPRQVDVRVICATNRNLPELIARGQFREDLLYRISVLEITAPPLADRKNDIPLLTGEFLKRFDPSGATKLTAAAISYLGAASFPGNVRQLKNLVERLTILYPARTIDINEIAAQHEPGRPAQPTVTDKLSLADQLDRFEKNLIEQVWRQCDGNISEAARWLKIDRAHLSRKIKAHGLSITEQ